jgi:polyisoprenyl-teichoic acid--peptidoglycan teichoic acid transferase
MTRRAWWLVVLNLVLPGSVQVLAGNRRLGRFGLVSTFVLVLAAIVAVVLAVVDRSLLLSVFTSPVALTVLQVALVYFVILWVILTLDTLRLTRLVRAAPAARPFIAVLTVVALVAVGGLAGYGAIIAGSTRSVLVDVFGGGKMADPVDGKYNIMLLGGDAGSSRVGLRPDSISVISIDAKTGATTSIGIPRNLQRVPFVAGSPMLGPYPNGYDCGVNCLISYLYTYGEGHPDLYPNAVKDGSEPGIEATRDAVEGVTGLTIQYFVLIDMGGFKDLVNALGGVDITVKERLPIGGEANASGEVIGATGWIEVGKQHMNGRTALWYSRSRQSTSDYDRMARQRQVEEAIISQFSPGNVLTKFQSVAKAGTRIVKTDIPQGMLPGFVDIASKARAQKMTDVELVPKSGVNVIFPNFTEIHATIDAALKKAVATAKPATG